MKAANLKVRRKISCLDKGKAWEFKVEKARESKRIDDRKNDEKRVRVQRKPCGARVKG